MTHKNRTAWSKRYFGEAIEDDVIGLISFDLTVSIMRCVVGYDDDDNEVGGVVVSRLVGTKWVDDDELYGTLQGAARAVDHLDPDETLLITTDCGTDMSPSRKTADELELLN